MIVARSQTGKQNPRLKYIGALRGFDLGLNITRKIAEGARQLDINLLDHINLTGDERYYSFAEEGDIQNMPTQLFDFLKIL